MGSSVCLTDLRVLLNIIKDCIRSSQLHRTYDNSAPGLSPLIPPPHPLTHPTVNDVCIHPNQGELISCDQAGSIKQWDLSDNVCSHELVSLFLSQQRNYFLSNHILRGWKTPAGDVPIRSVSLASDGTCLVAGNNKVPETDRGSDLPHHCTRVNVMSGK